MVNRRGPTRNPLWDPTKKTAQKKKDISPSLTDKKQPSPELSKVLLFICNSVIKCGFKL